MSEDQFFTQETFIAHVQELQRTLPKRIKLAAEMARREEERRLKDKNDREMLLFKELEIRKKWEAAREKVKAKQVSSLQKTLAKKRARKVKLEAKKRACNLYVI